MKREKLSMLIINPNAAGIDVGSKSHFVAIGQESYHVKEFGVTTSDLKSLVDYLKSNGIQTVAMESTGSYWQSLFRVLQMNEFEVLLVPGAQIQNVRGKTDVLDCQWIQKLHSLGLLRGCYLPSETTLKIRTLSRHRKSMVEDCSKLTNRMQKSLRLMNLRLDVAINDIMGVSGRAIIDAILTGEKDPNKLASLTNKRIRKSKEEVAELLHGQYQDELLFELEQNYMLYQCLQKSIESTDKKLEELLIEATKDKTTTEELKRVNKQLKGKNQAQFDLQNYSYKMLGVNLFKIQGVSVNTILTFISEVGNDIFKFQTSKQFVSWLRLAPNNKITGGKVVSSRTKKGKNKLAIAFRDAANTVERLKTGELVQFFKRIAYKKGRGAAVTAPARKIATIFWNMVTKKQEYSTEINGITKEKIIAKKQKTIQRLMQELSSENIAVQLVVN
jgi:transposase